MLNNKTIYLALLTFFIYATWAATSGFKESIPTYMYMFHLALGVLFPLCLIGFKKFNARSILVLIFIYNLVLSVILRECFTSLNPEQVFGPAVDSYNYLAIIKTLGLNNGSFSDLYNYIINVYELKIDDYGYPTVLFLIYKLVGSIDALLFVTLIFNSLFVVGSSFILHNIIKRISTDNNLVKSTTLFFGLFPFAFLTAAVGLKENIFIFFVLIALWGLCRPKLTAKVIVITSFGIVCCLFFRSIIAIALILALISKILVNDKNIRLYTWLLLFASIAVIPIASFVLERFLGISLEFVLRVAEYRGGGDLSSSLINSALGSLFGPFPNFNRPSEYAIIYSIALVLKSFLSYSFFMGCYAIIKDKASLYFPLVVYVLINLSMLILISVGLDFRFHVTIFPAWIIIASYWLSRANLKSKTVRLTFTLYCIAQIALIYMYNAR